MPCHPELVSGSHTNAMKNAYVYIMANQYRTTFYVGVTNDLARRVKEHKLGIGSVFTRKYELKYLVYYELIRGVKQAINREKELKNWHKDWKINLIKSVNPELKDVSETGLDWLV